MTKKSTTWNPYLQIARKIIQTNDERQKDIAAAEKDLERIKAGKEPVTSWDKIKDAVITLDDQDVVEELQAYVDMMSNTAYMVNLSFCKAVQDIKDYQTRQTVMSCLVRAIAGREHFDYLAYPLTKNDFDYRQRQVLKYILRHLRLMPYINRPADGGKKRKKSDD